MAARYRKVDPRFWKDEKVRRLAPEEKLVALYSVTAQSNRIGCFFFSPAMGAEDLGLKPETFAKRFANVRKALAWGWDEEAQVLYLPTWWKYNQPENQNNMIGNLKDLEDVPTSPVVSVFCANTEYLQNGLAVTFTQTLAERYPKRLASQEQEQEQVAGSRNLAPAPPPPEKLTADLAWEMLKAKGSDVVADEMRPMIDKWFVHRRKKKWAMSVEWWVGQIDFLCKQGGPAGALASLEITSRNLYQGLVGAKQSGTTPDRTCTRCAGKGYAEVDADMGSRWNPETQQTERIMKRTPCSRCQSTGRF